MRKILRMGIRPSRLALKQAEEIKSSFPSASFKIIAIKTAGDKDRITPLSDVEGSDFFTKEIDDALLSGEIDLAVHSSKDLPDIIPPGLRVILETESISLFDALVSRDGLKLMDLPGGSRVGSSSLRRKSQLSRIRDDLEAVDIRGTIEERLALVDSKRIDALIVAHAALIRLGLEERITEVFPLKIFQTHSKQGRLSLLVMEDRCERVKFILSGQARVTGN
ncbi:MAG: hydroxymethylbilane synthase [Candidatus Omnitrophica bacterium]|nr:hydroxymethylbilane synthase [Candidatus Omnitrophota bacterium]MDD5552286.1 hydroxymethylbilane synthase [Candidatus Omnitrophota bacterium]